MPKYILATLVFLAACGQAAQDAAAPAAPPACGSVGALATCLTPNQSAEYYVDQAQKYFDTLDQDRPASSIPNYSDQVARWEWEPWLKLTGLGRGNMVAGTIMVTRLATPSTVPVRDCRFFEQQPFARCHVQINYSGKLCPIYEEFTFNAAGEMTFIEAWSAISGFFPSHLHNDRWAQDQQVQRLATKLPGLGTPQGLFDLASPDMQVAAQADPQIADFVWRASDFWLALAQEVAKHEGLSEDDLYAYGCGW